MLARILALSALIAMNGCASSPKPLPSPMAPIQRPSECLMACPTLPLLQSGDEAAVVIWIHETISVAGECRRMHDACRRTNGGSFAQ